MKQIWEEIYVCGPCYEWISNDKDTHIDQLWSLQSRVECHQVRRNNEQINWPISQKALPAHLELLSIESISPLAPESLGTIIHSGVLTTYLCLLIFHLFSLFIYCWEVGWMVRNRKLVIPLAPLQSELLLAALEIAVRPLACDGLLYSLAS